MGFAGRATPRPHPFDASQHAFLPSWSTTNSGLTSPAQIRRDVPDDLPKHRRWPPGPRERPDPAAGCWPALPPGACAYAGTAAAPSRRAAAASRNPRNGAAGVPAVAPPPRRAFDVEGSSASADHTPALPAVVVFLEWRRPAQAGPQGPRASPFTGGAGRSPTSRCLTPGGGKGWSPSRAGCHGPASAAAIDSGAPNLPRFLAGRAPRRLLQRAAGCPRSARPTRWRRQGE